MKPKKWTISQEEWGKVEAALQAAGAQIDRDVKGVKEVWRSKLGGSTITLYETGTLYATPPKSVEEVSGTFAKFSEIEGKSAPKTEKDFLIGLDETGKGEVLGHSVLAGVILPADLMGNIEDILGVADSKKKKTVSYWNGLFVELDQMRGRGLDFIIQKIPPWHVDWYNLNKIMDVTYQRILAHFTRRIEIERCRIAVDDYGIGSNLRAYLRSLAQQGAQVVVEHRADEKYLESRLASVIAKREREKVMEAVNRSHSLPGVPIGSGNAGDPATVKWLEEYKKTGQEWPWFVKRSFKNIRLLDGLVGPTKKDPPIRSELLSDESRKLFNDGKLSVESLSVHCPKCGTVARSCELFPYQNKRLEGKCINCGERIANLSTTLLYYSGCIMPDSSIIVSGTLSKDLNMGRFFENFTVLLHPKVKEECEKSKGGRKELSRLGDFSSMGRISLEEIVHERKGGTSDELIVEGARQYGAVIFTRDGPMYASVNAKGMFCLKSL